MLEVWKNKKDYDGLYQISNLGRIKGLRFGKEKILKPIKSKSGYLLIGLTKNKKQTQYRIHRLVWETFNGEIPEGMQVNHIDEDKTNNRLDNLNLMTQKENINWGTRTERATKTRKSVYNTKVSKPVLQYDLKGNFIKEWSSITEISKSLNYNKGNISRCCTLNCNDKTHTTNGYVWKFKY